MGRLQSKESLVGGGCSEDPSGVELDSCGPCRVLRGRCWVGIGVSCGCQLLQVLMVGSGFECEAGLRKRWVPESWGGRLTTTTQKYTESLSFQASSMWMESPRA